MVSHAAFLAVIATLAAQTATAWPLFGRQVSTKIVSGEQAPNNAFPFIVSLTIKGNHFCGGSLLDANTVLTASHCLKTLPSGVEIQARAGSHDNRQGGKTSRAVSPLVHPQFTMDSLNHDVAILKLSTPINQSETIKFAKLPKAGSDARPGKKRVGGWGALQDKGKVVQQLRQVDLDLIPRPQCQQNTPGNPRITENMICAGTGVQDSCQGDSGGPLIDLQTGELEGVVSFGWGCARQGLPGVYARVGNHLDFIQKQFGETPAQPPDQPSPGWPGTPPDFSGEQPPDFSGGGQPIVISPDDMGGGQPIMISPDDMGGGQPIMTLPDNMDDTQLISPAMIDKITKLVDEGSRGILTENPSLEEGISAVQDSPSIEVAPGTEFNVIAGPDIV